MVWLTVELQKVRDCEECTVSKVHQLQQPDEDGSNWSDNIVVSHSEVPFDYLRPHLARILSEAKSGSI
jgi:hypothetical protein